MPSVRRYVLLQLALLVSTAHAGPNRIDPPYCATRITAFIADITGVAQQAVAITGDCIGPGKSDVDCALDILSMLTLLSDAAEMMSSVAFACAGESTDCEVLAFDASEYMIMIASRLLAAANSCDEDVFLCVIFCIDAADNIVNFANDVRGAVETCAPPVQATALTNALVKQNLILQKQAWLWRRGRVNSEAHHAGISPFYRAVTGQRHVKDIQNQDGGADFVVVSKQGGSGGTALAVDHPGIVRVGSEYVSPETNSFIYGEASAATTWQTRRLKGEQEPSHEVPAGSDDVLYYYTDADTPSTQLHEDYGFTLTGLE